MYELDFAFYQMQPLDQGGESPATSPPTMEDTGILSDLDTVWVRDLWIIRGEEVYVAIELGRKEGGRYEWTGAWKKIEQPEGDVPTKADGD